MACRILVPRPVIEPRPLAVKASSLNTGTPGNSKCSILEMKTLKFNEDLNILTCKGPLLCNKPWKSNWGYPSPVSPRPLRQPYCPTQSVLTGPLGWGRSRTTGPMAFLAKQRKDRDVGLEEVWSVGKTYSWPLNNMGLNLRVHLTHLMWVS